MLLSEAIKALCIATRADGRSPRTVQSYCEKLGHLLAFLGDVDVQSITVQDLRGYVAHLWDQPTLYSEHPTRRQERGSLSPFTVSTRAKAAKRLFNWLEAEGIIGSNPGRRITVPQPKREEPKGITLDDARALLATAEGDSPADRRDRAIMLFLLDSGCRAAGLCGLTLDDLDFDAGLAMVHEKGGKTRYVMFNPPTSEALQRWLEIRLTNKGPWVFLGLRGKGALTPNGVWQMLKRRAKQAGVSGVVGPHAWRHAFARFYLMHGGDLGTLSQILGHTDVRTTVDYYAVYTVGELKGKHQQHSPVVKVFGSEYNDR